MKTVFIFFLLIKTYLCLDIKKLFEDINREYGKFNSAAAELSWNSSVNPDNNLHTKAAKYQKELIIWQQTTCDTLLTLYSRGLLNATQVRQSYLLCRGPKFTYYEARLSSTLYDRMQSIYNNAEVCIPIVEDINENDLHAIEAAILKYLSYVKINSNSETDDYILYAAKLTEYTKLGKREKELEEKKKVFCLRSEDDFQKMMMFSKVEEVLRWLWLVWREKVGPPMKKPYKKFVKIENDASRRNGDADIGSSWRNDLEIKDLRNLCRRLYENILPEYKMLHGVARFYLRKRYGNIVPERGPIPAHLLGDLWSQNWESLSDLILGDSIDLNTSMQQNNWTITHMVKRAEDFYLSIGLPPMTKTFWNKSIFEREKSSLRCHGAAADMFKVDDFRILYCLDVSMEDFYGLHHELGHIQYYMAYENQPAIFRQANAAFHETIGDTIMLGVMTPQHLHRLGLIDDKILYTVDNTNDTNSNKIKFNIQNVKNNIRRKRENIDEQGLVKNYKNQKETDTPINTITVFNRQNTYVHKQKMEKNKLNNQNMNIKNKKELKRSKRTKREKYQYQSDKIDKTKKIVIIKPKFVKLETHNTNGFRKSDRKIMKGHNIYKRAINTFHDNRSYAIDLAPGLQTIVNDTDKDVDLTGDDDPLFNMKLDEILIFKQALNKLPLIPFALLIDEYRWKYFEGSLKSDNAEFWKMALELQGVAPTGIRGEEYFDAAAKFHVPDNTPFIRYFLSSFIQYQLFESFCKAAVFGRRNSDEQLPKTIVLNRCDIYGSKTVGKILKDFMSHGNSKHWRDILEEVSGKRDISSTALQQYYRPLFNILKKLIRKHHIPIGW